MPHRVRPNVVPAIERSLCSPTFPARVPFAEFLTEMANRKCVSDYVSIKKMARDNQFTSWSLFSCNDL